MMKGLLRISELVITIKLIALQETMCSKAPIEKRTWAPDFPYLWLILNSKASSASSVHARCNDSRECPPS